MERRGTRKPSGRAAALAVAAALAFSSPALGSPTGADCAPTLIVAGRPRTGDLIELRAAPGLPRRLLSKAIAVWERCPNYGRGFPAFTTGSQTPPVRIPARAVTVEYRWRSNSPTCGRFRGNEIQVYAFAVDRQGAEQHCGSPALVLAHELGHVLGLADGSQETSCRDRIMAYIDGANRYRRQAYEAECEMASRRWLTAGERRPAAAGAE